MLFCTGGGFLLEDLLLLRALALLADEGLVDVRDDATASDGSLNQGVQLFVTTDGQLQVTGGDTLHLQILGSVTGQLENLKFERTQHQ